MDQAAQEAWAVWSWRWRHSEFWNIETYYLMMQCCIPLRLKHSGRPLWEHQILYWLLATLLDLPGLF